MHPDDFEDALARALHGEVLTDLQPSPELLDALLRVAAAGTPAERRVAMRGARAVQDREQGVAPSDDEVDPEPW